MKIIAFAQNFGFGPISMLNRAIVNLPADIEVDYCVPEHLQPVLDPRAETRIRTIKTESEIRNLDLEDYDAAFIACDYPLAEAIYEKINKIVVYDMLFWFWPDRYDVLEKDILVIAQNFIGVEERAKEYRSVKVVGPLLPDEFFRPFSTHERSGTLVNLGGFKSPEHAEKQALVYLSNLYPTLRNLLKTEKDLCIAGGSMILEQLSENYPDLAPYAQELKHSEICEKMSTARMYFTISGLGSIYESFFMGVPTYFLPPTNFTQTLQLESVVSHVPNCCGLRLGEISNKCLELTGEEGDYIRNLFDFYELESAKIQKGLEKDVYKFLKQSPKYFQGIAEDSAEFIRKLGGPGEPQARAYVSEYLDA